MYAAFFECGLHPASQQDMRAARAAAAAAGPLPAIADRPARDFLDVIAERNPELAEGISRIRKLDVMLEEKTAKAMELVRSPASISAFSS